MALGARLLLPLKRSAARVVGRVAPSAVERHELGKYVSEHLSPLVPGDPSSHAAGERRPCPGIDFRDTEQLALVGSFAPYAELFNLLRRDLGINPRQPGGGRWVRNGYLPTPDVEAYASMIATVRPASIIEIGGGFSTLVARRTIDHLGLATTLTVVDPEPRTDVREAADDLRLERIETAGIDWAALPDPSIVFIDSSHLVRSGGDVPYLYGEVIPSLAAGTLVHVHDIFLPFDYSPFAAHQLWAEQTVLKALLTHSDRFEVVLALRYMTAEHPEVMARIFGEIVTSDVAHGGGSLWFRIDPE